MNRSLRTENTECEHEMPASREPFFCQSTDADDAAGLLILHMMPPHTRLFAVNSFHPVYNCVLTKLFCL